MGVLEDDKVRRLKAKGNGNGMVVWQNGSEGCTYCSRAQVSELILSTDMGMTLVFVIFFPTTTCSLVVLTGCDCNTFAMDAMLE